MDANGTVNHFPARVCETRGGKIEVAWEHSRSSDHDASLWYTSVIPLDRVTWPVDESFASQGQPHSTSCDEVLVSRRNIPPVFGHFPRHLCFQGWHDGSCCTKPQSNCFDAVFTFDRCCSEPKFNHDINCNGFVGLISK